MNDRYYDLINRLLDKWNFCVDKRLNPKYRLAAKRLYRVIKTIRVLKDERLFQQWSGVSRARRSVASVPTNEDLLGFPVWYTDKVVK